MSDNSNSKFPSEAEVVIVGVGGIVGSMLAYWLAELGQKNIVGLDIPWNEPIKYDLKVDMDKSPTIEETVNKVFEKIDIIDL